MDKIRNYKKILIVRLDRIGDVVLSTPVIKAVREAYPESHIAFMARPHAYDILHGNPFLNEVIIYDKDGEERGILGNIRFVLALRRKEFDLALVLHPTARTHWLIFAAGITDRIGYDRKAGFLLTRKIPHDKQLGLKHETDYALEVPRALGIDARDRRPYFPINEDSESRIDYIFRQNGITGESTVVVLNPSASCPSKRWQAEAFAEAADRIIEKHNARAIFISSFGDKEFADRAVNSMRHKALDLSGLTTIGDLASLLKRASVFISNDSGPVHIACAVGAPVIAIFGRNDPGLSPRRWGPSGERDIVLHKDVGCGKCDAHNCRRGFKCLKAITVDEVVSAAEELLK